MKKLFFLLLLTFSTFVVSAQYFEVGMKWTYMHGIGLPPVDYEIHSIEIVGDTIINGETRFILDGRCNCTEVEVKMISQEGQKVYYYIEGEKRLLYDYSLITGDTLQIHRIAPQGNPDSIWVAIDSVGTLELSGQEYSVQYVNSYQYGFGYSADWAKTFIEGLGGAELCFFPQDGLCEEGSFLRCITLADGTTIKFTDDADCFILGTDDIELSGITISPNPISDNLRIENPDNHSYAIHIFNQQGQLMFAQKEMKSFFDEIDTKCWPSGSYMVRLANKNGVYTKLLVKP